MMNIETLLQAAQILESQQSIPPKKRLARSERSNSGSNHQLQPPTINVLTPTTNQHPTTISSLIKPENSPSDLNLNQHHFNHPIQQRFSSDHHDSDDDDNDPSLETSHSHNVNNSEISNRTQSACLRDREIHNRLEKHRRAHLKDCFDSLKAEVPCQRDRKVTNLQVLNLAIKYIQTLTRRERTYDRDLAILNQRNADLQQRLNTLKTELNSQGHDVDTWLNSCPDIDRSVSTDTASEAEMYRSLDENLDDSIQDHPDFPSSLQTTKANIDTKYLNGHNDLDTNNNHQGIQSILHNSYAIDSKTFLTNRKNSTRSRTKPTKRKLPSTSTTNLLQTLTTSTPITISRSENLLDYSVARHLRLDQPCNLLTTMKDNLSSTATLTPITDIRYDIVDLFTKGTSAHSQTPQHQQQQQISPLPSIASLMNRHASPIVSPTKQTIGINTDPLTTSTTNILHQPVATS